MRDTITYIIFSFLLIALVVPTVINVIDIDSIWYTVDNSDDDNSMELEELTEKKKISEIRIGFNINQENINSTFYSKTNNYINLIVIPILIPPPDIVS